MGAEVTVIALGGMVIWESIQVQQLRRMDEAIVDHVKNVHKLMIATAEAAKIEVGSAWRTEDIAETSVTGRDLVAGLLRRVRISRG